MSRKIIGVTVGTPMSIPTIKDKMKPITSVNGVEADENGNVEITIPDSGGNVDLTGYAKEQWVQQNYQPKGEYLTKVPDGYAKTSDIPTDEHIIDLIEEHAPESSGGGIAVTGATVGQTVKISAVDENGVPTAWMPADFPSGGSGGGDAWRLIRTITTTEEVSSIDVSTDENGNAFSCKKVWCSIAINGSDSNANNDYLRVNLNQGRTNTGNRICDLQDFVQNTSARVRSVEFLAAPVAFERRLFGALTGTNIDVKPLSNLFVTTGKRFDTVNMVCVYSKTGTAVFGVGSTVELWGVDA